MKKSLVVWLICMLSCSLLTGCESATKLTLDNYKDYLNISGSYQSNIHQNSLEDSGSKVNSSDYTVIDSLSVNINVGGVSDNVTYKDVEVEITIYGEGTFGGCFVVGDSKCNPFIPEDDYDKNMPFTYTFVIDANIAGDGSVNEEIYVQDIFGNFIDSPSLDKIYYINRDSAYPKGIPLTYEVTGIKGKIVEK